MKSFFKHVLATSLGFILGLFFLFILLAGVTSLIIAGLGDNEVTVKEKTVLHLRFDQEIRERSSDNPFSDIDLAGMGASGHLGLDDILACIRKAAKDEQIKGIYLDIPGLQAGMGSTEEIRNALLEFKRSGKFIYSFADNYTQGAYYLASASDRIFLNPEGSLIMNGLSAQLMFFKGTLDKLEVEPQVIRHGKFKSAVEPYILDKMSDENRQQIAGFVDPIWSHILRKIGESRSIPAARLEELADSLSIRNANDALTAGLVDSLIYYDQFLSLLNSKAGLKKDDEPRMVSLSSYTKAPDPERKGKGYSKEKIAVIYAVGGISDGEGDEQNIGSDDLAESIRDARKDDKVKAIVLRVNSPGGDALASEEIWRETVLARKAKPVIVSMGDLAASGGYYISCAADTIVAQPTTLTGSIGVFGLMFNIEKMMKNKLGITTDTYKTGPFGDFGSMTRPMTENEKAILQAEVDRIYNVFADRVSKGRKMTVADVDSIAQGRVWTGESAKSIGLVDTLGGLDVAIAIAARKAKVTEYRISNLPKKKEFIEVLMEDLKSEAKIKIMGSELTYLQTVLLSIDKSLRSNGIKAFSPYSVRFD